MEAGPIASPEHGQASADPTRTRLLQRRVRYDPQVPDRRASRRAALPPSAACPLLRHRRVGGGSERATLSLSTAVMAVAEGSFGRLPYPHWARTWAMYGSTASWPPTAKGRGRLEVCCSGRRVRQSSVVAVVACHVVTAGGVGAQVAGRALEPGAGADEAAIGVGGGVAVQAAGGQP
jgi:hypothetical protein